MEKKCVKFFLLSASLLFMLLTSVSHTNAAETNEPLRIRGHITVECKRAIIRWRFKNIGGKAYKRQYNYTTDKWLGSWVPVV